MKSDNTYIQGLKIIHWDKHEDIRGSFLKVFNKDIFDEHELKSDFKESYFSVSRKNVIRGMHFQVPPAEHIKLVYVNQGAIIDLILDIRKNSPTFGKYFSIRMIHDEQKLIYIPVGCAHGFLSLENNTMVTYLQTSCYNKICDKGIRFNSFGFNWGLKSPIVSERDRSFVDFNIFKSPF